MSVSLHLARHGVHKKPFYRLVVSRHGAKRDGRYIELVGTYDPHKDPGLITMKEERVKYWIGVGARPTDVVRRLIMKQIPGFIEGREKHQLEKIQTARRARKARNKTRAAAK